MLCVISNDEKKVLLVPSNHRSSLQGACWAFLPLFRRRELLRSVDLLSVMTLHKLSLTRVESRIEASCRSKGNGVRAGPVPLGPVTRGPLAGEVSPKLRHVVYDQGILFVQREGSLIVDQSC